MEEGWRSADGFIERQADVNIDSSIGREKRYLEGR